MKEAGVISEAELDVSLHAVTTKPPSHSQSVYVPQWIQKLAGGAWAQSHHRQRAHSLPLPCHQHSRCFPRLSRVCPKRVSSRSLEKTKKIPWMEGPGRLQSMGRYESDTTEQLPFHFSLSRNGEGNGNPLQCSCSSLPAATREPTLSSLPADLQAWGERRHQQGFLKGEGSEFVEL